MESQTSTPTARPAGRFLTPDLARGLMLAPIALANVMIYLHARPYGVRQHVLTDSILDQIVTGVLLSTIDARAYPLFAALFGYGLVHMITRRRERGGSEAQIRRTVRRRSLGLILFGAIHAALAFSGDILGWYGLLGLAMVRLLRLSDRGLFRLALIWLLTASLIQGVAVGGSVISTERSHFWSYAIADPLLATGWRLVEWVMTPFGLLVVLSAMLIGAWAARHRVLEQPGLHQPLLRRVAVLGIGSGLAGGLPLALVATGVLSPGPVVLAALSWLHVVTGVPAGLGYAALIALVAHRLVASGRDQHWSVRALQATGQRSLSCYLAQSVIFAVLLPAGTLGWGAWFGPAAAAGLALTVWALTVWGAAIWADRPGPAETLLRHFIAGGRPARAKIGQ